MSPPIHPLTSSQGAVFLVNSCQGYFCCGPSYEGQALYRRYGCFFAEFLGDHSLVRLGLLDLITCGGLRYGFCFINLRDFSWNIVLLAQVRRSIPFVNSPLNCLAAAGGFAYLHSSRAQRKSNNALNILTFVIPSKKQKSWNINHVSIRSGFSPSP